MSEQKQRVRIGILGTGSMAVKHVESIRGSGVVEAVGVSGAGSDNLERFAAAYGIPSYKRIEELFEACDAVDVCLPTFTHKKYVCAASTAGRHVICEKPIALDMESAVRMKNVCDTAGVSFMVAHCLRFMPEYAYLKNCALAGSYGVPLTFAAWRFGPTPQKSSGGWLLDDEKSGGPAIDLQIHDADMIQCLFGMPVSVRAFEKRSENVRQVSAEYSFPNGPAARADAGWFLKKGYSFRQGYRMVFEDAVFECHSDCVPPLKIFRNGFDPMNAALPDVNPYRMELEYFSECVLSGEPPQMSSAEDAMKALAISLATRRSAALMEICNIEY